MARTRRVLIIGAGSSGLAAVQQALDARLEPVCIEANPGVGGAWRYDADAGECKVEFDEHGMAFVSSPKESDDHGKPPPSPMYAGLKTNVPTALMQFRGFPFSSSVPLFCSHSDVQSYLERFSQPFLPFIRFNTRLVRLRHTTPSDGGEQRRWLAEIRSTLKNDGPLRVEQFDAVSVATGHYSKPYIPWINGLSSFKEVGEISHARWFREPSTYKDKTVLVIGNSASGYDITRELASQLWDRRQAGETNLPKLYQSARSPPGLGIPFDAPDAPDYGKEVTLFPPIQKVEGKRIDLEDGRGLEDVDVIIFATGYYFSFPFLSPSDGPFSSHPLTYAPPRPSSAPDTSSTIATTNPAPRGEPSRYGGLRVHNLDERMLFYLPDTTLAFLGLPYLVIPFPLAQLQARLSSLHFASSPRLPRPLSFRPDPLADAPETRAAVVWGHPKQFDEHDTWLRECGDVPEEEEKEVEGEGEGSSGGGGGGLTGERALWGLTSQAERDLRQGAKGLRKAVLGY